jgi:diguanylate cyclase (GGDEF)-like protein/PAS domain S-box-containing protein
VNLLETLQQLDVEVLFGIIANNGDGILITDANKKIIAANEALARQTGYSLTEMEGSNPSMFSSGKHDAAFYQHLMDNLHADGIWHGEFINKKKNGVLYYACETISVIRNGDGDITHYVSISRDNTKVREAEIELKNLAFRDPLTGLYNRRYFFEYLETQINHLHRTGTSYAVLIMDLDDFSEINNTYGHSVGDELLISISSRLNNIFNRKSDVVARMGGDEFIAILTDIGKTPEEMYAVCESFSKRLIRSLSQPHKLGDSVIKASSSIGLAYVGSTHQDVKEIVRQADNAMYRGKKAGKNTYKIYPVL